MAFKGTTRRTARQIAEEIEAVGGDLNAATSVETTAYYARVLKADVPLALDVLSDILSEPTFDAGGTAARAERDRAGDRRRARTRPTIWCSTACRRPRFPSQPVGRSILGTPETVRSFDAGAPARLSRAQLPRARHGGGRRRRGRSHGRSSPRPSSASPASPARRRRRRSRRISAAARASRAAISSRCISRWRCRACRCATRALQPAGVHQRARRRHVVAPVPGGAREARPLLFDLRLPHALCRHRHVRRSMPAPTQPTRPS